MKTSMPPDENIDAQILETRGNIRKHEANANKSFFTVGNFLKTVASVALPVLVMPLIGAAYAAAAVGTALVTRVATHYRNTSQEAALASTETANVKRLEGALTQIRDLEYDLNEAINDRMAMRDELREQENTALLAANIAARRIAELEAQLPPVPVVDEPPRARTPDALQPAPFSGLQRQNSMP